MERVIKFQAWCPATRRMFRVELITWGEEGLEVEGRTKSGEACTVWGPEPVVLRQFTGLLDCDGAEVYEGDVLEYQLDASAPVCIEAVKWHEDGFWGLFDNDGDYCDHWLPNENIRKVIGNVHEHPELLK